VVGTASTGQSDQVEFKVVVSDGCNAVDLTKTVPADQSYVIEEASLTFDFEFGTEFAECSPTFTYSVVCYTDNTYTVVVACPSFITRPSDTSFSVESSDIADVGDYFYEVEATASSGQVDKLQFKVTVTDGCEFTTLSIDSISNLKKFNYLLTDPALQVPVNLVRSIDRCTQPVTCSLDCFTDNAYTTSQSCPTILTYSAAATK